MLFLIRISTTFFTKLFQMSIWTRISGKMLVAAPTSHHHLNVVYTVSHPVQCQSPFASEFTLHSSAEEYTIYRLNKKLY